MCQGTLYRFDEIKNIQRHPVINRVIKDMVFVTEIDDNNKQFFGYPSEDGLYNTKEETIALDDSAMIRVAHAVDLYKSGMWSEYQCDLYDRQIRQPFKQVFRELYLPNADELQEKNISRRYAGHQVQTKKTAALLRSRDWTVSYEDGLQKVYHNDNIIALCMPC